MTKVTLANVGSIIDATTAETNINNNSAAIVTAVEKTLSRDGTSPNTMEAVLDMNGQQILNLPNPATNLSPLRLQDLEDFVGGGTISTVPAGGTTDQALTKVNSTNYNMAWTDVVQSVGLSMPADFTITNSPVTSSGTLTASYASTPTGTGLFVKQTSPTLITPALGTPSAAVLTNATGLPIGTGVSNLGAGVATFLNSANSTNLRAAMTDETGTGSLVFATSPTLVTPVLGTPTSGTLTSCTGLPISTGVSGLGTNVATFLATPSSANLRGALTDETGSGGAAVFATSPTITNPNIVGTATNDNAAAGSVGEYVEGILVVGSATALTTATAKTITNISLTAGDWDVETTIYFIPTATTSITDLVASLSGTTNTLDTTVGKWNRLFSAATVDATASTRIVMSPRYRLSLSGTTSVFAVAQATFTASTLTAYGIVRARRVR